MTSPEPSRTLLPVVLAADSFPAPSYPALFPSQHPTSGERYIPFHLTFADYQARLPPVGQFRPHIIAELQKDERGPDECPWQFHLSAQPSRANTDAEQALDLEVECVFFAEWVVRGGSDLMGTVMQATAESWRDGDTFSGALKGVYAACIEVLKAGWRNERYSVYAPRASSAFEATSNSGPFGNFAFALERAACALLGVAMFGVHLTAYEGEGEGMKIWVPRRSASKQTFPGMLDNTVAGGIPSGMLPLDAMLKECDEEASLPEAFVRPRLRNVGLTTYLYYTPDGYLQPEIEYVYDLPLPEQSSAEYIKPRPNDDEVESFALLTIPDIKRALYAGEFKPNCGLIIVDFLIRHGMVTPENEPNYIEICWRMHRRLAAAVPM